MEPRGGAEDVGVIDLLGQEQPSTQDGTAEEPSTQDGAASHAYELSRRELLAGVGSAATAGAGLSILGGVLSAEPAAAAPGTEVGARNERTVMEFVARIDQDGLDFVGYGFFSFISGLRQELLFSSVGDPLSESTAHFTLFGTGSLVQRSVVDGRVFVLDVEGELGYFFQANPGATFNDPPSFGNGRRIASNSFRFQDILGTIAPNEGIPTLTGTIRQTNARRFSHDGKTFTLGHEGLGTRLFATGRATRTDEATPVAFLSLAGNILMSHRG